MKNISIIGVGLIGGSLGMALKKKRGYRVTGVGRHPEKLRLARRLGAVDAWTADFREGTADADIVVVAAPVGMIVPVIGRILPSLSPGTVITDAGSVKGPVTRGAEELLEGSGIIFAGSHPMAGSEKTGVRHASRDLFRGASVVITPPGAKDRVPAALRRMWTDTGAKVLVMSPEKHDRLAAVISHLPHVLSAALVTAASAARPREKALLKDLIAGSFRDMTRVSDSDPVLWTDISVHNSSELAKQLDAYTALLKKVRGMLGKSGASGRKLYRFYGKARNEHKKLIR